MKDDILCLIFWTTITLVMTGLIAACPHNILLTIIYVIILIVYSYGLTRLYKAIRIITYPERFYIRRYENTDLVEYIKVKYIFDLRDWTFTLYNFHVMGWQSITLDNIIDYEHELQCEWLEPITEEQYNEFKMLEELNK